MDRHRETPIATEMKTKHYLLAFVALLSMVAIGAFWQYNKPSRNLTEEKADLSIAATELYRQFSGAGARRAANRKPRPGRQPEPDPGSGQRNGRRDLRNTIGQRARRIELTNRERTYH